ncbi:MAG: capsid assembly protein [Lysobacteraceae bacterium]
MADRTEITGANPEQEAVQSAASEAARKAADEARVSINGEVQGGETPAESTGGEASAETPKRPDNVPEKFWNAETGTVDTEALLRSYTELETKQSQPKPEGEGEGEGEPKPDEVPKVESNTVDQARAEYERDGKIGEETLKALEAQGITRSQVTAYVQAQEAMSQMAYAVAGGQEQYQAMLKWGADTLSTDEKTAFDAAIDAGPVAFAKALRDLHTRYQNEATFEGRTVDAANVKSGGEFFRSKDEMVKAMSDPRYKTDSAYRDSVAQKLAASERAGVQLWR